MRRYENPNNRVKHGVVTYEASITATGGLVDNNDAQKLSARDLVFRQEGIRAGKLEGEVAEEALDALGLTGMEDWKWTQCRYKYCFRPAVKGTGVIDDQTCSKPEHRNPVKKKVKPRKQVEKKFGRTRAA
jgi:hypothetical protein